MGEDLKDLDFSINPIIKTLSDKNIQKYFKFNVFLVNIATLFRNNFEQNLPISQLKKAVESDLNTLIDYFKEYNNKQKIMILYTSDYSKYISDESIRNNEFVRLLFKINYGKLRIIQNTNTPNALYDQNNTKIISIYISDYRMIDRLSPLINNVSFPVIAMISNVAWDFLIFEKYKGAIIESFSGRVIEKNQIPLKVFKNKFIPFNKLTYRLLGDKSLFKPVLLRNKKKEFFRLAEEERFNIISQNKLKSILIKNNIVDEGILKSNFVK